MDESIARLMNMGFAFDLAINALDAANNNESLALQFLIEGFPETRAPVYRQPKPKSKTKTTKSSESLIQWEDGRDKIYNKGIQPFFDRIEKVFNNTNERLSKQHMIPQDIYIYCYDLIFTMCIQREEYNHSASMYTFHGLCLTDYFVNVILVQLNSIRDNLKYGHNDIEYVEGFIIAYKKCQIAIKGLNTIFHYLNRFYVPNHENTMTTAVVGLLLYFDKIFCVHSKYILRIMFKYIELCRDYKLSHVHNFTQSLMSYDYYKIKELIDEYIQIVSTLDKGLKNDKTGNVDTIRCALNHKTNTLLPHGFIHEITGIYSIYIPKVISRLIINYYDGMDALSIYEQYFVKSFEYDTHMYYNDKCNEMMKKRVSIIEYVDTAEKCMEYETNQRHDILDVVRQMFYNEERMCSIWRLHAIHKYSPLTHIHKYSICVCTLLRKLKGNEFMMQLIVNHVKMDVDKVFKYYVMNSKRNMYSKDVYIKYKLMYDSCSVYEEIMSICCSFEDVELASMLNNTFYKLFAELIGSELDFVCNLLAKFTNYILYNSDRINYHIESMMSYIVFIHKLINFIHPNCDLFVTKYRYFFMKRWKRHRLSHKRLYFEYKMIEKLDNNQLTQWVRDTIQ